MDHKLKKLIVKEAKNNAIQQYNYYESSRQKEGSIFDKILESMSDDDESDLDENGNILNTMQIDPETKKVIWSHTPTKPEDDYGVNHYGLCDASRDCDYDTFMLLASTGTKMDFEWCLEYCNDTRIFDYIVDVAKITDFVGTCYKKSVENNHDKLYRHIESKKGNKWCIDRLVNGIKSYGHCIYGRIKDKRFDGNFNEYKAKSNRLINRLTHLNPDADTVKNLFKYKEGDAY
jgi:hypothetical protein